MNAQKNNSEWYCEWFNSPYYHILYKTRDHLEAEQFIKTLISYLSPPQESIMLDAACGKGRHAIYLASFGFHVDAFDLSSNNIKDAKKHQTPNLNFFIHDIRDPLKMDQYDYVFNMFTSFGYFENQNDNLKALQAIHASLKKDGLFIMDFMNVDHVINKLVKQETKTIDGITFHINKSVANGFIEKNISFTDQMKSYQYQEQVRIISRDELTHLFLQAGFEILHEFGDYTLNEFDPLKSDRIIIIAKK